jgi:diguanylate cyclase (GGDEF)-like protein
LPKTSKDEAILIATRIKNIIENHSFNNIPQVTVSIGISVYNESIKKEIFLKDVDDALYKAKNIGRNRVEFK